MSSTWPACNAPIVGTRPTRWPRSRALRDDAPELRRPIRPVQPRDSLRARSAAVGAVGVVQAIIGDHQVVQDLAAQDRLGHDSRHILDLDPSIPDSLRIDHHRRSVLALLQAPGMVCACQRTKPGLLELFLERLSQLLIAVRIAAATLVAGRTHVATYKYMMGKRWHGRLFRDLPPLRPFATRLPDRSISLASSHFLQYKTRNYLR